MFEAWGFLLAEIWILLALAAACGVAAGYFLFGAAAPLAAGKRGGSEQANRLRAEMDQMRLDLAQGQARIAELEDIAVAAGAADAVAKSASVAKAATKPAKAAKGKEKLVVSSPEVPTKKPMTLDAPRKGVADDLKRVEGIDTRTEQMCHMMGIWHYQQIAAWSAEEIAWVEVNLHGAKGNVLGKDWVGQAKTLAAGELTPFAKAMDEAAAAAEADDKT